ncbi:MAG: spermidine/putrescine ABC transporter substrate-binding protein [Chloroflexota bacterium]
MAETLDEILKRAAQNRVPRRSFLAASGLLGASAALAACGGGSTPTPAPATAAPATPSGTAPAVTAAPPATSAPVADVEKQLFMYNWSDYINPDNIDKFKAQFGVEKFQYDTFANNDELMAKMQAGATGYDITSPTGEYVPALRDGGFIQQIDKSRIPNWTFNKAFQDLVWDPTNTWFMPKDFGTTGILVRSKFVTEPVTSWKEFADLVKGKYSGKAVFVDSEGDVMCMPLKMIGKSLNSVEKADLDQCRTILMDLAPHILALDSDTQNVKLAGDNPECVLALGWTGILANMRKDPKSADIKYVVPTEGTLFWLDTWVLVKDAPNPNAAYAFLNFIEDPENQGNETNYTGYGTPNDAAKQFVDPTLLNDPAVFPPADAMAGLEPAVDTSNNQQRIDIWQEFKSKIGQG